MYFSLSHGFVVMADFPNLEYQRFVQSSLDSSIGINIQAQAELVFPESKPQGLDQENP
jgi:hypothetical protein